MIDIEEGASDIAAGDAERAELARRIAGSVSLEYQEQGSMGLLTWTSLYRAQLRPGVPFDLKDHRYLIGLFNCTSPDIVVYKSSQMGASEYLVSAAIHACDRLDATVLYIFPTYSHISDFSTARIGPAIEASAYLASIISGAGGAKTDRVGLKRIGRRFLYLRGGTVSPYGNAPQLKSVDADVVILDEVDEMDSRVIPLAEKRLGHSNRDRGLGLRRAASTPTYEAAGIHAMYLESDRRQWFVPCPHCGEKQVMTMDNIITEWDALERPVEWHGRKEDTAYPVCVRCGGRMERLAPGEWVAEFPKIERAGFHLTRIFSPHADLGQMVLRLQETDEATRKEAFNQDWGLPFRPRGGQLTDYELNNCHRDYRMGPVEGEETVAGVDVGSVLHVIIRGKKNDENGERPLRFAGIIDSFDELKRLIRIYNVRRTVVDLNPEARSVREFQDDMPNGRVWAAVFRESVKASPLQHNLDEETVFMDRTRCMDVMMNQIRLQEIVLPRRIQAEVPDYYDHMKAPIRTVVQVATARGDRETARYVSSRPDHFCFAEVYCWAAGQRVENVAPSYVAMRKTKGW